VNNCDAYAHSTARRRIAETSLFFFGEIGVNDYFLALASNHTVEQAAATLVPDIVGVIRSAVIVRSKTHFSLTCILRSLEIVN
jgi:hypothetical protein